MSIVYLCLSVVYLKLAELCLSVSYSVYYHNPLFNITLFFLAISIQGFSLPFAYVNVRNVLKGRTTKQLDAISKFVRVQ